MCAVLFPLAPLGAAAAVHPTQPLLTVRPRQQPTRIEAHVTSREITSMTRPLSSQTMNNAVQHANQAALEVNIREMLALLGEDPNREGLRDTPRRIASMYAEMFEGLNRDPAEVLAVGFEEGYDEIVILRDIPFYSMCEHHFMPFHGSAHVGYLPNGRIVGLSKLARAVEILARRPQVQERLTTQIADCIENVLDARGVGVVIEAEHLCMTARGIRKPGARMVTSAMRGHFREEANTRQEFLNLIRGDR